MAGNRAHSLYPRNGRRKGSLPQDSDGRYSTAARRGPREPARIRADHALGELAALSRALFGTADEGEILRLAMHHVNAAGP